MWTWKHATSPSYFFNRLALPFLGALGQCHRAPPSLRSGSFQEERPPVTTVPTFTFAKRSFISSPYPNAAVSRDLGPWRLSVGVANYILLSLSTIHFLCLIFEVFWQYWFGYIISSSPIEHALYSSLQAVGLGKHKILVLSLMFQDLITFSQRSPSSSRWDNSFWKELNSYNR